MNTSIFLNNNNEAATIKVNVGYDENNNTMTENKTWEQLTDSNKQDIASQWIKDHVHCNVNQVMELLSCCNTNADYEDYLSIAEYKNYEDVVSYHIEQELSNLELIELANEHDLEFEEDMNNDDLAFIILSDFEENDFYQQYAESNDLEPEYQEAYEFWSVSDHFVAMLSDSEQCSKDILGLSVWARYCTGQSICLDVAIQKAAFKVLSDTAISNY